LYFFSFAADKLLATKMLKVALAVLLALSLTVDAQYM
jgi:hypothetical protein